MPDLIKAVRSTQQGLRRFGLDVRRWQTGWTPDHLQSYGVKPGTVIDVGVAGGTPALYAAFPDSFLVLIEPLAEFERPILDVLRKRPGELIRVAAGATNGHAEIAVHSSDLRRSSLEPRRVSAGRRQSETELRKVDVATLDSLAYAREWPQPWLLKIDCEGHEFDVIEGARKVLSATELAIVEISVAKRFASGYRVGEFIDRMTTEGFILTDILEAPVAQSGSGTVTYIDGVFMPR